MQAVNLEYTLMEVGAERSRIVVIDNFWPDCAALVEAACAGAAFGQQGRGMYPGVRAALPEDYLQRSLAALLPLIRELFAVPEACRQVVKTGLFSLVSTPAHKLSVLQSIPHFDSARAHQFALLHYLNPGDFGGTGFFRHRPTGYESVSETRVDTFIESCKRHWQSRGYPEPGYVSDSDDHFERIATVAYQPNRLLIYDTRVLHSALVDPARDLDANPASGRLTANLFVDFAH